MEPKAYVEPEAYVEPRANVEPEANVEAKKGFCRTRRCRRPTARPVEFASAEPASELRPSESNQGWVKTFSEFDSLEVVATMSGSQDVVLVSLSQFELF